MVGILEVLANKLKLIDLEVEHYFTSRGPLFLLLSVVQHLIYLIQEVVVLLAFAIWEVTEGTRVVLF